MEPLDGNPGALAVRAEHLGASAQAIKEAAEALFALTFAGSSDALEAIAGKADDLADKVRAAHGRYQGTASALSTFAVDLQSAHNKANDAIEDDHAATSQYDTADDQLHHLRKVREQVEAFDPNDPRLHDIDDRMRELALRRAHYDNVRHDALAQRAQAQNELNAAAERAIRSIDTAMSVTNDGFWDHVGNFVGNIGSFLDAVANWVAEVLKAIVTGILIAIAAVVALVILALLVIAFVAWLVFVAPLLALIGSMLLLAFLLPGLDSWRTPLLAMLVSVAVPLIGGLLVSRVLSDVLAPTPTVTELDPNNLSGKAKDAQRFANDIPGLYALPDYLTGEGLTDTMGGEDRSVVDVRKVVGPDGVERWVVTLPSTQDWLVEHGDTGATNDLDSNLALMLTPELQTQYERAVLEAMQEAGIGKDDPVMLVGFSQGGIMAGHLAADRSSEYNFAAVLAYGAPIDAMNIPDSTKVLSIQHTGDIVPTLDLTSPQPDTANHHTVQVDANDGTIGINSHSNAKYHDTAAYSAELAPYQHYFDEFSGTVTEQHQYTWQE